MRQEISVLMDGELDDQAAGELIEAMARHRDALETWRTYHLIGDALRASAPPVVVARRVPQPRTWYALAAGVAAVALVGWLGFAPQHSPVPVATAPSTPAAQVKPAVAPKPAMVPLPSGTNDYLLAHQGFSPRVSLQGVAAYVRTVSERGQEPPK
ncbi:MAG TPA: sigma-E factor negative regulatory protein [Burkholderiales bacterium]|jgi:sigma-E factor negative regulatory protein RseA|nr:sigma-E factor negative regulatory protein [Burkholderiales bacterium]